MTLSKRTAAGIIILVIFLIIGFISGMKYLQNNNTLQDNEVVTSPASIIPSVKNISPTGAPITAGMFNPASVFCEEQGGKSEIITASDGSQTGQCIFADGKKCSEWQFFRTKTCN